MPDTIFAGARVRLDYEITSEDLLIDTTATTGPLELVVGSGRLHPVIESRLIGLAEGESFEIVLDPEVGFGAYDNNLRIQVAKRKLPEKVAELPMGATFETFGPDNKKRLFRVLRSDETTFVMDGNHPLAGRTLYLEGRVVSVEAPLDTSSVQSST
jgi:FKBP-type peptidyl-prolyl cis-trans isomerase SlyD